MLVQFNNSAIVRVMQVFEANNTAYFAMPYYQGETLKEQQERQPKLWK